MREVYLDNAATTRNKPVNVKKAMLNFLQNIGCSPGRGGYKCSIEAGKIILTCRSLLARLFNVPDPKQIIFTQNVTTSINYALKGLLRQGDHVITSTLAHNAVLRPLNRLVNQELITVDYVKSNKQGLLDPQEVEKNINDKTRMLIFTHASNVTGTLLPVEELAAIAEANNLLFVLDTAQTAGIHKVDFTKLNIDVLCFTGHKTLMGPPGTGGFIIDRDTAKIMKPLIEGGTGSSSNQVTQPEFLPDKFESGTLNSPGITGLSAGLKYIFTEGPENIKTHKTKLTALLLSGLTKIKGINIHGPADADKQTATVSVTIPEQDPGQISYLLDKKYNIMTRSGLHCAPLAHKTINTYPEGTLRLSIGYFNTEDDIHYTLDCLNKITAANNV
ncbi:MAG: aminotransferase class V-fold PLP-dependent enzyme [Halanaerobiales bacterium]